MWEKLADDGSVHDKDTQYTLSEAFTKAAFLNADGGFAGHSDWRVPNVNELQSLADYGAVNPAVSPAFNTGCVAACTVLTCSCTQPHPYWSSSTHQYDPINVWVVAFDDGRMYGGLKPLGFAYVRVVRGGS